MAIKASYTPTSKKQEGQGELTFVQPTAKVAPSLPTDEPVVRDKKATPPVAATMESVLAEWAD
jgi:hypothetical protein